MSTGWTRRRVLATSALSALFASTRSVSGGSEASLPWRNWSGGLVCQPQGRFSPATEAELSEFLAATSGEIRPVGSGHSFAPLVPTDGHLVVIDQLSGMLDHSPARQEATFGAGSRLGDMGRSLKGWGRPCSTCRISTGKRWLAPLPPPRTVPELSFPVCQDL